jgi:hypothetical protein
LPNPTVRRERIIENHRDGTVTEIIRQIRANGDKSEMVFYREGTGASIVIWHVVYDAANAIVHGPHEKFRRTGDLMGWPPPGYTQ